MLKNISLPPPPPPSPSPSISSPIPSSSWSIQGIDRKRLQQLANAFCPPLAEDESGSRQHVLGEVEEAEAHSGSLSRLQGLSLLDADHLRRLTKDAAVDDGLVPTADGRRVVENDLKNSPFTTGYSEP